MTGPEHVREAKRLLRPVERRVPSSLDLAAANAHLRLAELALTVAHADPEVLGVEFIDWRQAVES